ncbi:hypothetical protein RA27_09455 [Ruegeria sp. ANG-R]|uniref:hypothetical protein n=1 Tax=Ruegeria sp. ANG-R TaxID=1577903 RepID=UPI00057ED24D|nr:hypothetical protein [Ruegeria sp. ANG-R]KIC41469.1 hypothetical protein RA27_09455 [Ruegeria sp. ANG-R]
MRTGSNGQIAIFWNQTEIDGLEAAPLAHLAVGRAWSWRGRGIRLVAETGLIARQAETSGVATVLAARADLIATGEIISDHAKIEFSNGAQTFVAELVRVVGEASLVLVFEDGCPEPGQEFWISAAASHIEPSEIDRADDDKVVAFPAAQTGARSVPVDLPKIAGWAAE